MNINLTNVQHTLLIPLYVRYKDATSKDPKLNDQYAVKIVNKLQYSFDRKYEKAWISYYGVLARAIILDNKITEFIQHHPDCTIISIGCGLDTRFFRIDNGNIIWFNLDLPDVIELREHVLEPHPRIFNIGNSVFNDFWIEEVFTMQPDLLHKPILIISEGVFMYFTPDEVKKILHMLTKNFTHFDLYIDCLWKYFVNRAKHHDMVNHMDAEFKFGTINGRELTSWEPKLTYLGCINNTDEMKLLIPGIKKLLTPLFYITNNRLCMYRFAAK